MRWRSFVSGTVDHSSFLLWGAKADTSCSTMHIRYTHTRNANRQPRAQLEACYNIVWHKNLSERLSLGQTVQGPVRYSPVCLGNVAVLQTNFFGSFGSL